MGSNNGLVDKQLMKQIQEGDAAAFDTLFKNYHDRTIHYLLRFQSGGYQITFDDAEDIYNTSMLKVYERSHSYIPKYAFCTWLYTIVGNEAKNILRKKKKFQISFTTEEDFLDLAYSCTYRTSERQEQLRRLSVDPVTVGRISVEKIRGVVEGLPHAYRDVVIDRLFADEDYASISEYRDLPIGTVKSRIVRGRQIVREALEEEFDISSVSEATV